MIDFKQFAKDNISSLQEKDITNITKHKIDYISDYVYNWSVIGANYPGCKQINFIDCMCNAGIYKDATLTTSMRVLQIFIQHAKKYPNKIFNLFLNDYDLKRVEVITKLSKLINQEELKNINIIIDKLDVNNYLASFGIKYASKYLGYGTFTVLFVDPYNFGTVNVKLLHDFSNKYYTEVIFNYFSSDYLRNINNMSAIPKIETIKKSMDGVSGFNENMKENEVLDLIQSYFKTTKIKYSFAYQFRTKTNIPLYSILYCTPNKRGLEEIKESYWKVFDGNPFFRNDTKANLEKENTQQFQLFDDREINELSYATEARVKLIEKFMGSTMSYEEIVIYVLESTMLKKGQVLKSVIKPLLTAGKLKKLDKLSPKDYTHDLYYIVGDVND